MDQKFVRKVFTTTLFILPLFLILGPNAIALELVISGNGAGSSSEVNTTVETTTEVVQTNTADVSNDVAVDTNTGGNEANENNAEEVTIDTGDASSEVEIANTNVNTSVVNYDGCCEEQAKVEISNNAGNSDNTISLGVIAADTVSVSQTAVVANKVHGVTNTGSNAANNNSSSVSINTGDAKVTGGIVNGPINTTLIKFSGSGIGNLQAVIKGNGQGTKNNILANIQMGSEINKMEYANIFNDVIWDVSTGRNRASGNNGPVHISTGNAFLDFLIANQDINSNYIELDQCCGNGEPTPTPTTPPDPSTTPTPSPTPGGGNGGNGDNGSNGGGGSNGNGGNGGDGGVAAAAPAILGLSATSATGPSALIFWAGLIMIAAGTQLLLPSVLPKK